MTERVQQRLDTIGEEAGLMDLKKDVRDRIGKSLGRLKSQL